MSECTDQLSDRAHLSRRALSAAVVAFLLLLVGGCGGARASYSVERAEVHGANVTAVVPTQPAKALVLYLHGLDEDQDAIVAATALGGLVADLASDGYVVVASEARGNNFGSPAARADFVSAADWARSRYGTDATFMLAESMGGLSAIPLAASGEIGDLRGTAGINPAISLTAKSGDAYRGAVQRAWGDIPGLAEDPLSLPAEDFTGQSFRLYVASDDKTVPTSDHAAPFAARLAGVADVSLVRCEGQHVDPSCFRSSDLLPWLNDLLASAGR